jgi:pyruvate dehydrogenase (quinone)
LEREPFAQAQGEPKFSASQDLPDAGYAELATQLGLRGITVDAPSAITAAWEEAFTSDRPIVVEAIVDPDVPALPPHITAKQARNYLKAILRGDPDAAELVKAGFKQLIA